MTEAAQVEQGEVERCGNGHIRTAANTLIYAPNGVFRQRQCLDCRREYSKRQYEARSIPRNPMDRKALMRLLDAHRDGVPESVLCSRFDLKPTMVRRRIREAQAMERAAMADNRRAE